MSYVGTANSGADALQPSRSNTKPGGAAAGDIAVFYLGRWNESASFPAPTTVPSGAVLLATRQVGLLQLLVYVKYVVGGETTYTFDWGSSRWGVLWSTYFTGRAQGLTLSALTHDGGTGSGTSITSRSVTAQAGDDLAWGVDCHEYNGGETHTPPTSFTEVYDNEAGDAAYRLNVSAGTQTASGATISASQNFAVELIALPAASSGVAMDLGAATGSGAGQSISLSKLWTPGQAAGTGAAQQLALTKVPGLGAAAGSGAAQALSLSKALPLGAAAGVGAPQAMAWSKAWTLDTATGASSAQALAAAKTLPLGPATGTGTPQAAGFTTPTGLELGPATGTGAAQPMAWTKAWTLDAAIGTGAPAGITDSKSLTLGQAAGTGAAQALAPTKAPGLQNATGTGAPQVMTFTPAGSMALGPALGSGAPQAMAFSKARALGAATGAGAAQGSTWNKTTQLGAVTGSGSPRVWACAKLCALVQAQGSGAPQAMTFAGPFEPYEAPENWTAATRDGATVLERHPSYTARTRAPQYAVTTRKA